MPWVLLMLRRPSNPRSRKVARGGGDSEKVADSDSAGNDSNEGNAVKQGPASNAADVSQQEAEASNTQESVSEEVAEINGVKYATLQAAFDAATTGCTINVLTDVDLGTENVSNYGTKAKNVTVDFGGNKITSAGDYTLAPLASNWIFENGTIENTKETASYGAVMVSLGSPKTVLRGGSNGLSIISKTNGIFVKTNNGNPTLTIENGVNVSGKIGVYLSGATSAPFRGQYSGTKTLNVYGGSINGTEAGVFVVGSLTKNAKECIVANVSGGTITGGYYAVAGNGESGHNGTEINISGGTLKSTSADGAGVYHPQKGALNISGGTIEGAVGVQMCAGDLNVTGNPTIKGTGADATASKTGDGAICDGSAISIVDRGYPGGKPTAKVSSGTITSEQAAAVKAYGWSNNATTTYDNTSNEVAVSGGTFKAAAETAAVDSSLLAKGFELKNNEDGTITVGAVQVAKVGETEYTSLQEAINAADAGATVTLLADVDTTSEIRFDKDITVDFNGKKIENTADLWDTKNAEGKTVVSVISVKGNVTFRGNGKVVAKQDDCYAVNMLGGALTIEDGEYVGNISAVQVQAGTLAIKGGKFSQRQESSYGDTYLINCIDDAFVDGSATVAISGGEFKGFDPVNSPEKKVNGKTPSFVTSGYGATSDADGNFSIQAGKAQVLDADGNSVKVYDTLAAAIAGAEAGQTIALTSDVTENVTVTKESNIALDLNGFKLTNASDHTITNNGTLTIKDSSAAKTGTVDNVTHGKGALVNNGTVTLDGGAFERSKEAGTLEPYANGGNSWYTVQNNGTMTVNDGVTVKNAGGYSSNLHNAAGADGKLVINGGTFTGGVNAVKNEPGAKLEIAGGTFANTSQYVIMNWGDAAISGGTFTAGDTASAVLFTSSWESSKDNLSIAGGTYSGSSKMIRNYYDDSNRGNASVSGGTFSAEVPADCCAENFAPAKTTDASGNVTYGVASGLVNFWGGSLRMDKYEKADGTFTTDEADLRFGFNFDLPEGATRTAFGFDWGTSKSKLDRHVSGINVRDAKTQPLKTDPEGVSGTISNLVVTNIPKGSFGTVIYAQMWVTYELNGVSYTIHTDVQSRSVSDIATKIKAAGDAGKISKDSKEYKYASALLELGED